MFSTEHEFDPIKPTIIIKANFGPDTTSSKEMYESLVNALKDGVEVDCKFIPQANGSHGDFVINLKPKETKKTAPPPIKATPTPIPPKAKTPQEILAERIAKDKGK